MAANIHLLQLSTYRMKIKSENNVSEVSRSVHQIKQNLCDYLLAYDESSSLISANSWSLHFFHYYVLILFPCKLFFQTYKCESTIFLSFNYFQVYKICIKNYFLFFRDSLTIFFMTISNYGSNTCRYCCRVFFHLFFFFFRKEKQPLLYLFGSTFRFY